MNKIGIVLAAIKTTAPGKDKPSRREHNNRPFRTRRSPEEEARDDYKAVTNKQRKVYRGELTR